MRCSWHAIRKAKEKTNMDTKPTKIKRGRAFKYDWTTLRKRGWIFIPAEGGHSSQGCSIRSAAANSGFHASVNKADLAGASGFMVEVVKRGVK